MNVQKDCIRHNYFARWLPRMSVFPKIKWIASMNQFHLMIELRWDEQLLLEFLGIAEQEMEPLSQLALHFGVESVSSHLHKPGRRLGLAYDYGILY